MNDEKNASEMLRKLLDALAKTNLGSSYTQYFDQRVVEETDWFRVMRLAQEADKAIVKGGAKAVREGQDAFSTDVVGDGRGLIKEFGKLAGKPVNLGIFTGRLGRDAETRDAGSTTATSFSVGNDVGFGAKKTTQWVDCTIWGDRGVKLAEYLKKGQQVTVQGEITLREFKKRDGSTDKALALRVSDVALQGGKPEPSQEAPRHDDRGNQRKPVADDLDDDCIPF